MPLSASRPGGAPEVARWTRVSLAVLMGLAAGAPGALAQQQDPPSLREAVSTENLYLAGARADETVETPLLQRDDLAVLVGARDPVSLNDLLAAGVPVRSSRLQQLMAWGVLEQRGMRFQSRIPVLTAAAAEDLRAQLADTLEPVVGHVARTLWRLRAGVGHEQHLEPLPTLTTWILRHRVWRYLAGQGGIELGARIAEDREAYPDRPWWGPVWYVESPAASVNRLMSQSADRYTLQVCWPADRPNANPFALWESGRLNEFLHDLDDDGEELDDRDDYPELQAMGIVGPDKRMNIVASKWEPGREDSPAFHVDEATQIIGNAVWSTIHPRDFREALGVPDDVPDHVLWPVLYRELVPILLSALEERGVPVRVEPQARSSLIPPPPVEGQEAQAAQPPAAPPVRIVEESQDAAYGEVWIEFSAFIWRELQERRGIPELPW